TLGGTQQRATRRALQDEDGCRRNGHFPSADHFYVYRQLLADQSQPVAVVSQTARDRLRRNAKTPERFRESAVAAASRDCSASAIGGRSSDTGIPATCVREGRRCRLDSGSEWQSGA